MRNFQKLTLVALSLIASTAFAAGSSSCDTIAKACKTAGYKVYGDKTKAAKSGRDLWSACYCPMVNGTAQPANAKFQISSTSLTQPIAQCKQAPKYANKCQ